MEQEEIQSSGCLWSPTLYLPHWVFININNSAGDFEEEEENDDEPLALRISQEECVYTKPFIVLDVIWNLAFLFVSAFVLFTSLNERPSTPLRLWISGYALRCLFHLAFLSIIHFDYALFSCFSLLSHPSTSFIRRVESINTVVSSVWWVFGFYWILTGGQSLLQDSPRLYWLLVIFLAFDAFFMIFCIVVACIASFALFCCFPILATVAYAMTIDEGASESDIRTLPKYRYRRPSSSIGTFKYCKKQETGLIAHSGSNGIPELALNLEDSECCICLHTYVDGVELCTLPCNHHFHHRCIRKWLRINATCPLCKFNITTRGEMLV